MKVCTFFGHSNIFEKEVEPKLREVLTDLIENKNVNTFYVGNHGGFDFLVRKILKELKQTYPINYYVVLAYIPTVKDEFEDYSDTIFPDVLAKTPYKYRIVKRNEYMLKKSDCVIAYVKHIGGAKTFFELAQKQHKTVINIAKK